MSPIWNSMVEPGRTQVAKKILDWLDDWTQFNSYHEPDQILYCVDSSDPMMIGAATISLIQLLHHPALQVSCSMVMVMVMMLIVDCCGGDNHDVCVDKL